VLHRCRRKGRYCGGFVSYVFFFLSFFSVVLLRMGPMAKMSRLSGFQGKNGGMFIVTSFFFFALLCFAKNMGGLVRRWG
jgi:hypothetical protein